MLELPDVLALAIGRVGDLLQRMKVRTQLCTRNVRQLLVCEYYDNGKARRQLAMPQTPIADAVKDFLDGKVSSNVAFFRRFYTVVSRFSCTFAVCFCKMQ